MLIPDKYTPCTLPQLFSLQHWRRGFAHSHAVSGWRKLAAELDQDLTNCVEGLIEESKLERVEGMSAVIWQWSTLLARRQIVCEGLQANIEVHKEHLAEVAVERCIKEPTVLTLTLTLTLIASRTLPYGPLTPE